MTDLKPEDLDFLNRYGFDQELFASWQEMVAKGEFSKAGNIVSAKICAPGEGQVHDLPKDGSDDQERLRALGTEAIRDGKVAVVVLNGGMATRFGGVVKGTVPVLHNQSFLELKIRDTVRTAQACGGKVPMLLMNSFATDEKTKEHLEEHNYFGLMPEDLQSFTQFISVRMNEDGSVFRTEDGSISPHGPGHGDFVPALRASGHLERLLGMGIEHIFLANVDNLGARLDPLIVGHHIDSRCETTVEVAPKWPGDAGGAPYLVDGKLQLIEGFRYPEDFDPDIVDVFNTNTFHFSAAALDRDFSLGWYYVEKKVEDRKAIQIERIVGEMTRFLKSNFVRVKRTGANSRFFPVKTPDDLKAAADEIAAMFTGRN